MGKRLKNVYGINTQTLIKYISCLLNVLSRLCILNVSEIAIRAIEYGKLILKAFSEFIQCAVLKITCYLKMQNY